MKARKGESNWEQLLEACQKDGKEEVIKKIEAYHNSLEWLQADLFANPETVHRASKMSPMLLKQDETLIRLRAMSDEDIRISLETGEVGVHKKENNGGNNTTTKD